MANTTVTVLEADGVTATDVVVLDVGRQAAAASKSLALATEDKAELTTLATLSKAEDAAHSSADTGIMALAVRKDTASTGIGADGDYVPLAVNASGELHTANSGVGATGDSAATAGGTGSLSAKLRLATTQLAVLTKPLAGHFETVAASQTDQMLGATGAAGDYLAGVLIIPATTSPGAVSIEDGSSNTTIFTGGASSVSNLVPFFVPLGIYSVTGGWEITTGANVSAIGVGSFT